MQKISSSKVLVLLILYFCIVSGLCSQTYQPAFQHLNVNNGLSQSTNKIIFNDSKGFIWIGSGDGLNRFDGKHIIAIPSTGIPGKSLMGSNIHGIVEDSKSNIWIGTNLALNKINTDYSTFHTYYLPLEDSLKKDVNCTPLIIDKNDLIWLLSGEKNSLLVFNTKDNDVHRVLDNAQTGPNAFIKLVKDPLTDLVSDVWVVKGDDIINYKVEGLSVKSSTIYKIPSKTRTISKINDMKIDASGDVWLAANEGLFWFDPQKKISQLYSNCGNIPVKWVNSIAIDSNHVMWVGTNESGIWLFDTGNKTFFQQIVQTPQFERSLSGNQITKIQLDRFENIWISVYNSGIDFTNLKKRKFPTYPYPNFNEKYYNKLNIQSIAVDMDGNLYCASRNHDIIIMNSKGKIKGQILLKEIDRKATSNDYINHVKFDRSGNLWLCTTMGLFVKMNKQPRWNTILSTDPELKVYCSFQDSDGNILIGTNKGIGIVSEVKNKKTILLPEANAPNIDPVNYIFEDTQNRIYAIGNRILRIKDNKVEFIKYIDLGDVYSSVNFGKNIWIGSNKGLIKLDPESGQTEVYSTPSGLKGSNVYGIVPDQFGLFWLSTSKGIESFNPRHGKFRNYDLNDGIQGLEFGPSAYARTKNGKIVFGGINGVNIFDPIKIRDYVNLPIIHLLHLKINEKDSLSGQRLDQLKSLELDKDHNSFSLDFVAIEYAAPDANQYRVRLEGYDKDWVTNTDGVIRYTNLPPGTYKLKIKASNPDDYWTTEARVIDITVKPPFYLTKLFLGLCFLLLVTGTFFITKMNTDRLLEKQKIQFEKQQAIVLERSRIAADMHDDLGSGLSMIAVLSEIAKGKAKGSKVEAELENISGTANELIDKMGEIIWAINVKNDKIDSLIRYIRTNAIKFFDLTDIKLELQTPDNIPDIICSGKVRRNIFLTVKESLNNVLKHSKASQVSLHVTVDSTLNIQIQDNGQGFDRSKIRAFGNGLHNMQKRIEDIGGTFHIDGSSSTTVKICYPLKESET